MLEFVGSERWESLLFMLLHDELQPGRGKVSFLIAVACVGGVILG
jgi:hypothetical protein